MPEIVFSSNYPCLVSEKAGNKRSVSAALCVRVVSHHRELVPCLTTWNRDCKQTNVSQMHRDANL